MSLFNTKDGELFTGVFADMGKSVAITLINKAAKGTPQYEEWLRKYREKRGKKTEDPSVAKKVLEKKGQESIKELKLEISSFDTFTEAVSNLVDSNKVNIQSFDDEGTTFYSLKDTKAFADSLGPDPSGDSYWDSLVVEEDAGYIATASSLDKDYLNTLPEQIRQNPKDWWFIQV